VNDTTPSTIRPEKLQAVELVRERFSRAVSAVLLDFRGIDVLTISDLRNRFRDQGVEYRVVKNNLVKKALLGTSLEGKLDEHLKGPTGIAWSFEDPSAAAKIVRDFRKEDVGEKLGVKCGLLDETVMEGPRVETELASMPGKDEVRAMLLAQMMAPAQRLVQQLGAPAQNLAYALDAYRRQQEGAG